MSTLPPSVSARATRSALACLAVGWIALAQSCGFPDHSFIPDDEFYGSSGGEGAGGPDASVGGAAGGNGGSAGSGGSAGATTGGSGATGGIGATGGGGMGALGGGGTGAMTGGGGGGSGATAGVGGDAGIIGPDASIGRNVDGGLVDGGPGGLLCEGGLAPCGDTCVDLMNDIDNCGVCGTACDFDEECVSGLCDPICAPGLSLCGVDCFDFQTDDQHCGDCTTTCPPQEICNAGTCEPPCAAPLVECDSSCVNTQTDESYCGGCNTACASNEVCESGNCRLDCGSLTRCVVASNDVCVDINTDENHCNACNAGCSGGQVCSGGSCTTVCSPPFTNCGGSCVDTSINDSHCNTCDNACLTGQDCIGGVCTDLIEDCTNGTDDDEDGNPDCMDSDCTAGYTCASRPSGWTGPVALWTGSPGATPSCSSDYPSAFLSAFDNLSVAPTTCPSCTCAPSAGATCDPFSIRIADTDDCSGPYWLPTVEFEDSCDSLNLADPNPSANSARVEGGSASYANGICEIDSNPAPTFPTPIWGTEVAACGAPTASGGGCGVGSCVPRPEAPFHAPLCIFRSGVSACPPDYPNPPPSAADSQYYQTYLDGRSCSNCSCAALDCGGDLFIYTDNACVDDETQIATDGSCTVIPTDPTQGGSPGNPTDTRALLHLGPGPVCGDAPRTPLGTVTPDTAVTICCE